MYKLSIIVPTYNGAAWISDTLESVLSQIHRFKDEVEFIVRDNCSTDKTGDIVLSYNHNNEGIIKYDRRATNTIADINYKEAIELSQGEYVVLLGDDDLLFPDYIRTTLELLETYKGIGLLYYNRICTTREYEGAKLKHLDPCRIFVHEFEKVEDFIKTYPTGPDFISVNVVKRECLLKGFPYSKNEYYGVGWYSVVLAGLKGYKCLSSFRPMILQRVPKVRVWNDRALLFVVIGMDNMFRDISKLYPSAYQSWQNYAENNVSKMSLILQSIPLNRNLYKEKWGELKMKLNTRERIAASLLINYPFTYLFIRIIYKIARLIGYKH